MLDPQLLDLVDELRFRLLLGHRDPLTRAAQPTATAGNLRVVPRELLARPFERCPNPRLEFRRALARSRGVPPALHDELAPPLVPGGGVLLEPTEDLGDGRLPDLEVLAVRPVAKHVDDLALFAAEMQLAPPLRIGQVDKELLDGGDEISRRACQAHPGPGSYRERLVITDRIRRSSRLLFSHVGRRSLGAIPSPCLLRDVSKLVRKNPGAIWPMRRVLPPHQVASRHVRSCRQARETA